MQFERLFTKVSVDELPVQAKWVTFSQGKEVKGKKIAVIHGNLDYVRVLFPENYCFAVHKGDV